MFLFCVCTTIKQQMLVDSVHCAALRCAALRCAALRCAALRCAALRCAALRCAALRCAALRCAALRCATSSYNCHWNMESSKIYGGKIKFRTNKFSGFTKGFYSFRRFNVNGSVDAIGCFVTTTVLLCCWSAYVSNKCLADSVLGSARLLMRWSG